MASSKLPFLLKSSIILFYIKTTKPNLFLFFNQLESWVIFTEFIYSNTTMPIHIKDRKKNPKRKIVVIISFFMNISKHTHTQS